MGQSDIINLLKKHKQGLSVRQMKEILKISSTGESVRRLKKQGDISGKKKEVDGYLAIVWRLNN